MLRQSGSSTKPLRHQEGRRGAALFLPLAAFAVFAILSEFGAWRALDRAFSDFLVRLRIESMPLAQSPRILPVDLNDRAERNLGEKAENRQAFVDLFTVLGEGHLTGAMDFLFQGRKDDAIDAAMVQAAGKMSDLVLAVVPIPSDLSKFTGQALDEEDAAILRSHLWHPRVVEAGSIPTASTFLLPSLAFARKARHLGHVGVTPDSDGLYRKVPLFYRWEDGFVPLLALAMAVDELRIDPSRAELRAGSELVLPRKSGPAIRIPIDRSGSAWIPYPCLWDKGWKRTPLDKIVASAQDKVAVDALIEQWSDGIVVAADLTTSHKDFGPTPLEAVYPLSGIFTSLLNGILTSRFYRSPPPLLRLGMSLALLAGIFTVAGWKRDRNVQLGFAALLLLLILFVSLLWFAGLVLPWFIGPSLGLAAAWIAALALKLLRAREERLLLASALSRYFPRALAARVLDEKRIDLEPSNKELTLLFADIAGFTKWSSDKSPELVHGFLTEYLESMAAIVFAHGGTVDKFMGDGMLAFFGDPWEQPDHAARCLRAALAMQDEVRRLRDVWGPKAGIDLKIRIGINSGRVIVGNLGSRSRIEYTVIGAAVNLGQRMESNAPLGGILVAADTLAKTREQFRFGDRQAVAVKGYEKPVEAYVLEGEI